MTARLSLRWMIAVAAMALVLTLLISGIVLSLLGFPVVTRVKNTALGVVQGLFPTNRPAPAAGAQAEIDALRAQVSALQAQLDDAKRQLQQARASAQGSGNSGGAPWAPGPGGRRWEERPRECPGPRDLWEELHPGRGRQEAVRLQGRQSPHSRVPPRM
ncbi:hypothetical protein [Kyrpidia spormannii]|uniref:Uncharacterized protein n=1 Tax=Kyrpidia spormannii TaxID=2055160 RepID=A0A6F9E9C3_9BACL|nr:hypothetical protein [Kyrpidia spormannii]CAB3393438.1 protein of unknown function [Kyrpidia spormannii]